MNLVGSDHGCVRVIPFGESQTGATSWDFEATAGTRPTGQRCTWRPEIEQFAVAKFPPWQHLRVKMHRHSLIVMVRTMVSQAERIASWSASVYWQPMLTWV